MLFPGWGFFLSQKKPAIQASQLLTELIKSPSSVPGPRGRNRSIKITLALGPAQRPITLTGPGKRWGSSQSQKFGPPIGTGRLTGGVLVLVFS